MNEHTNKPGRDDNRASEKPLQSWKEIAAYLGRDESTARRWERLEDLPVRRHRTAGHSSVYAYPSELEAWRAVRKPKAEDAVQPGRFRRRALPMLGGAVGVMLAIWVVRQGPILNPPDPLAAAANTSAVTARQIWTGGSNFRGTPSPDGSFFSCIDWTTGDLGICDPATGQIRKLTNKGAWEDNSEYGFFSTVSPDGQKVAYSWFVEAGTELRVVDIQKPSPRVLVSDKEIAYVIPFGWSPDGKLILTTLERTDKT